jgi:hypothetical protein
MIITGNSGSGKPWLAKKENSWLVEGVFGELAEKFMDRAQCFVWLDIDWPLCRDRLLQRGCESSSHMDRQRSQEDLRELIEWASYYDQRENARSYAGHKKLMEQFKGKKIHPCSEADAVRLVEQSHSICKVNQ